jgi:hypothetical protein
MRQLPTPEQRTRFLKLVSAGNKRPEAARTMGLTGSAFKTLCNPKSIHYDEKFAQQYADLVAQEAASYKDEVWEAATNLLLERLRSGEISDRLLSSTLAGVDHPLFTWLKRSRIEHTGPDGGPIQIDDRVRLELVSHLTRVLDVAGETPALPAGNGRVAVGGADG